MFDREQLKKRIAEMSDVPLHKLNDDVALNDLFYDSFAIVDMTIGLQEELDIIFMREDLEQLHTLGQLFELVEQRCNDQAG